MAGLTTKQKLFCDEYLIDLNATQAAIRAGYSEKTAGQIGDENLKKPQIQEYLAARMKEREKRTEITQDYVFGIIQETVDRCRQVVPVLDKQGNQVMVETPTGEIAPAFVFDPKSVLRGCELMGKHLGMFSEKIDHKHSFLGADGKPLEFRINTIYVYPEDRKNG